MNCSLRNFKPHSVLKSLKNEKKRKPSKSKKLKKRKVEHNINKNFKHSSAMSAWAENFTAARIWQLQHQLAYWKARAVALEYENGVLHDVIRRNNIGGPSSTNMVNRIANNTEYEDSSPVNYTRYNLSGTSNQNYSDSNEHESESDDNCNNDEDLEVSEEFIQFLMTNAKYKEDAKRERERLKAEEAKQAEINNSLDQEIICNKELYGDNWQRINGLEMHLMSSFVNASDSLHPAYWPNIPFNFN